METPNQKIEHEITPKDISAEFLSMSGSGFWEFLRALRNEPALSITIDWVDVPTARKLKAFLEDFNAPSKQKRSAIIRATQEQYEQEPNVFSSGVQWEKINIENIMPKSVEEAVKCFLDGKDDETISFLRNNKGEISEFCLQIRDSYGEDDKITPFMLIARLIERLL